MRSFVKIELAKTSEFTACRALYRSLGLWCEVCIKMEIETDSDLYF